MLHLLEDYGSSPLPDARIHHLHLPRALLLIYPSADSVILRNALSLRLVRTLAFWEAFPGTSDLDLTITCLSVDPAARLIAAAAASRVAFWTLSDVQEGSWRIHSSLELLDQGCVTSLHCQSGLLAVGCSSRLHVYTLTLENDLPTWSRKWATFSPSPKRTLFSPSLMRIATSSSTDNVVRIYSTASGQQIQALKHPYPVKNLAWRISLASSRDDLILYTTTSDATVRIFMPVLDSPHHLQLHMSLDVSLTSPTGPSGVIWINGTSLAKVLNGARANINADGEPQTSAIRQLEDVNQEGRDLFIRSYQDGSVEIIAVANIDRRPPTLLRQFTLMRSPASYISSLSCDIELIPLPPPTGLDGLEPDSWLLLTVAPLSVLKVSLSNFFNCKKPSPEESAKIRPAYPKCDERESPSKISRFVRTSDGTGIAALRSDCIQGWMLESSITVISPTNKWEKADLFVVVNSGCACILYSSRTSTLSLKTHFDDPPIALSIPAISSLFSLPSSGHDITLFGITPACSIVHIHASLLPSPSLSLLGQTSLPLPDPPRMILPVDPMAWSTPSTDARPTSTAHEVLVSLSNEGFLSFWAPGTAGMVQAWNCTGTVKTGRTEIRMARCSSAKKTVLVTTCPEGDELTIWDSKESEFASGMEFRAVYSTPNQVNDLDWTSTPDAQSILAVGFVHRIDLLYQQRMTYFDEATAWGVCWSLDLACFTPYPIRDSIWLAGGSLLVGAGSQLLLFSDKPRSDEEQGLFEHVARRNGPLQDYHPQMLLQCLLWDKLDLVKDIIVNISKAMEASVKGAATDLRSFKNLTINRVFDEKRSFYAKGARKLHYSLLFENSGENEDDRDGFLRHLVEELLVKLESSPIAQLTAKENAHLLILIRTTLEVDEQNRALDANGRRYLISMRSFRILNEMVGTLAPPGSNRGTPLQHPDRRDRLRYRDIIWAFHSQSQDLLIDASTKACKDQKMLWSDARALGVFMWMTSVESMRNQMEVIARNQYMSGDARDPEACSLFYFALGKSKLVHGLWRSAAWHKEQAVMLRFLSNDFSEARWKTAALKNAFALLSKRRFEYAAAFFLLGGSLKDAVNVLLKQLNDMQLAVALARILEQGDDGPMLESILKDHVIQTAFKDGNRWLGSWAFWLLKRRDLAVRVLITPLSTLASLQNPPIREIGEPHYDDPSLALLYSQIRLKTLQTLKGTSEISGRTEFNFVLQIARVFCRMGCHILALDLVRSWTFHNPSLDELQSDTMTAEGSSPTMRRRPTFAFSHIRRQSVTIDMNITGSAPATRANSPASNAQVKEDAEGDLPARKTGLGRLIQSAKAEKAVPEFSMDAFEF